MTTPADKMIAYLESNSIPGEETSIEKEDKISVYNAVLEDIRRGYDANRYNPNNEATLLFIITSLARDLHALKSSTYKNSWKKRGWAVSIFGNISRKFDRLDNIFTDIDNLHKFVEQQSPDSQEGVLDTFVDLGVYCFLAATEIAVTKPRLFEHWLNTSGLRKITTDKKG